jgi:hypothetical protein|tara:strand:- start:521 stop:697 length:177 start_codon:yes stop_codon:yes gene_type:complete
MMPNKKNIFRFFIKSLVGVRLQKATNGPQMYGYGIVNGLGLAQVANKSREVGVQEVGC